MAVRDFQAWLPELWAYERDRQKTCYWIMQPFSSDTRTGPWLPTEENDFKPQYFPAKDRYVDAFNALIIDCDVGRESLCLPTAAEAADMICCEANDGKYPPPSFIAHSGRGVYAIWQLRELVPNTLVNEQYRWRVLRALARRMDKELQPDTRAMNSARFFKLPGTLDTKTQNRVRYVTPAPDVDQAASYTLLELGEAVGVAPSIIPLDTMRPPPQRRKISAPQKPRRHGAQTEAALTVQRRPGRSAGDKRHGAYPSQKRMFEIERLACHREGIREGQRYFAVWRYFGAAMKFAKALKLDDARKWAVDRAIDFARNSCNPPLSDAEVLKATKSPPPKDARFRQVRADTLAAELSVTEEEAAYLGLFAIAPESTREQLRAKDQQRKAERKAKRADLKAAILRLRAEHPQATALAIARTLNVSRQRVEYHLPGKKDEIDTTHQAEMWTPG